MKKAKDVKEFVERVDDAKKVNPKDLSSVYYFQPLGEDEFSIVPVVCQTTRLHLLL